MSAPSDQQLIQYIGQGRRDGLAQLFDRYSADLYDFLGRLVGDRDQASRLLEEVFMRVPGAVAGLPPRESVRGWLYSLAREAGLNWLRQKGWLDSLPPADEATAAGLGYDVWKAARGMPAFYRAVLILEELHSLSPTEKARALGVQRTDLPRLIDEARKNFTRIFDSQARAEGRPTSNQIDPERVWGLQRRLPVEGGSLFGFLPVLEMPDSLQQSLRRKIIEAMAVTGARTTSPVPAETTTDQDKAAAAAAAAVAAAAVTKPATPVVVEPPIQPPPSTVARAAVAPAQQPAKRSNALPLSAIAALIGVALALAICGGIYLLTQDRSGPTILTVSPANGATLPQAPVNTVLATFKEDRGIDSTKSSMSINGQIVSTTLTDNGIAYSGPLNVGSTVATVLLTDRTGNSTHQTWTFFVTSPLTPTAIPNPNATITGIPTVTPIVTLTPVAPPTNINIPTNVPPTFPPPPLFTPTPCLASISGSTFIDLNNSGFRQPNDPGLAGVPLTLQNLGGGVISVGVSDSFGNYQFANLPLGQYRVLANVPPGWFATSPVIVTVNVFGCGVLVGVDFGFAQIPPPPPPPPPPPVTWTRTWTPVVVTATPTWTPVVVTATSTNTPTWTPIVITATPTNTPTASMTPTPSETPTASPTATQTVPVFKVDSVVAQVTPVLGTCPPATPPATPVTTSFVFSGSITVSGVSGSGNVTYHWRKSDGSASSDAVLTFLADGAQPVATLTWDFNTAGINLPGSAHIEVMSPNAINSNNANFTYSCP